MANLLPTTTETYLFPAPTSSLLVGCPNIYIYISREREFKKHCKNQKRTFPQTLHVFKFPPHGHFVRQTALPVRPATSTGSKAAGTMFGRGLYFAEILGVLGWSWVGGGGGGVSIQSRNILHNLGLKVFVVRLN